jgi:hypothetical protein
MAAVLLGFAHNDMTYLIGVTFVRVRPVPHRTKSDDGFVLEKTEIVFQRISFAIGLDETARLRVKHVGRPSILS